MIFFIHFEREKRETMTETRPKTENRLYLFDNLKGILMLLVVFGHFLECCGLTGSLLYRAIYSFHMPLFLFISGFFTSFSLKKLITRLVFPYFLFQSAYLLFSGLVLSPGTFSLQYKRPYWILWYLFALIIYTLLSAVLNFQKALVQLIVTAAFLVLSLAAGFSDKIGYDYSLSRILVFAPFFFAGFYLAKHASFSEKLRTKGAFLLPLLIVFAVCAVLSIVYLHAHPEISARVLYGANPYSVTATGPLERLSAFILAAVWIVLSLFAVPNIRIPILSTVGKNTLSVYLLHVFVQRLFLKYGLLKNLAHPVLFSLLAACLVTALLGQLSFFSFKKKKPLP